MNEAHLLRLGQFVGQDPDRLSATDGGHLIRLGWRLHRVEQQQYAVWRSAGQVRLSGVPEDEAQPHVAALRDRGLLCDVPAAGELEAFARTHRAFGLYAGLGNSASEPDQFAVGVDDHPVCWLDRGQFAVWQNLNISSSIFELALARRLIAKAGSAVFAVLDSDDDYISHTLEDLRSLVEYGVAVLDVAGVSPSRLLL